MEIKDIITLIQTVSESKLTKFSYEEGDTKLCFEVGGQIVSGNSSVIRSELTNVACETVTTDKKEAGKLITSPMVGTYYCAQSEDAKPFISVGDSVKKGQVIGIVEAMKLMNEIESPYDGIVEEILVKNKEMVGFGQNLVRIRP